MGKPKDSIANLYIVRNKLVVRDAMLCSVLGKIAETYGGVDRFLDGIDWTQAQGCANGANVKEWWAKHKTKDAVRLAAEQAAARTSGLAKLTPAERRALGV